jgi:hypothetical protein
MHSLLLLKKTIFIQKYWSYKRMTIVLILNQSYNGTILVKNNITSTLTSEHIIWICSYCGYISCCHRSSHKQFEDAKGVLRSCNSKKDRQYSDQKKDRQYSDQKKDRQYSDQKKDRQYSDQNTDNTVIKRRTDNTVIKRQTIKWPKEGQTIQWPKEWQTIQWPNEGQTIQWPKEGQTIQWPKEQKIKRLTMVEKILHWKLTIEQHETQGH